VRTGRDQAKPPGRRCLFAGSDLFFDDGEGTAALQGIAIGSPAEDLDGDIGADAGAQCATDTLLGVLNDDTGKFCVALLAVQTQQFSLTGGRAKPAALASGCINFDPGNHLVVLEKVVVVRPEGDTDTDTARIIVPYLKMSTATRTRIKMQNSGHLSPAIRLWADVPSTG
jgi:hypothetical protein